MNLLRMPICSWFGGKIFGTIEVLCARAVGGTIESSRREVEERISEVYLTVSSSPQMHGEGGT